MTWKEKLKAALSWCRAHRTIAIIIAVLLTLALASAYGAWTFRGKLQESKKAEKVAQEQAKAIQREAEIQADAFRKAIGATEPALQNALAGVKQARASLAQAEEARRGPWIPPAVDNLASRFDRALEAIR